MNSDPFTDKINKINKAWRPATAIVIVTALVMLYVVYPIMCFIGSFTGHVVQLPEMLFTHVDALAFGVGGILASLRTVEKVKNATNNH